MNRYAKPGAVLNALLKINCLILTIFALTGCGGSADIPEASVLSSGRLTLSWEDVPGAASYDLYISTSPGITTINSYRIADITTPITITDLEPGTTYYFIVMVYSDSGDSRNSKEVSYTVAETEGTIDFGDLLAGSEPLDQSSSAATEPADTAPQEQTAAPKTEGPAASAAGTEARSETISGQKPVSAAAIPKAPPSSAGATRDVTLAWDNVPGATSYNIYWRDKPGVTRQNGTKIANVKNPHKLKGLIKGKKYYFVITAVNASGESSESEELSFTVGQ